MFLTLIERRIYIVSRVCGLTHLERRIYIVCGAFVASRIENEEYTLCVACLWPHAYGTKHIHCVCSAFVVSRLIACMWLPCFLCHLFPFHRCSSCLSQRHTWRFYTPIAAIGENRQVCPVQRLRFSPIGASNCQYLACQISAIKFAGIRQVYPFPRFSMFIAVNRQ